MNTFTDGIEQIKEIHQSNHSVVFVGIDKKTGEKLAIKVLNEEFPNPQLVARFNEEAEISQRFPIKGLRKIIDKRKINNRHALIMEYIEGVSFQEMIAQHKMDHAYFLKLAIRAASILAEIHHKGIIHKDINPKNLLIDEHDQVYLIDLGIASVSKKEHQKLQAPDKLEGTLAYISPEQTGRMNHAVDARSDLYSLGITFYEMLTGVLPFDSADSMELVHSHIAKIAENPGSKKKSIPPIFSKIIMKLIEKDIYKRYQTALGLRIDLEHCLAVLSEKGEAALQKLDFALAQQDIDPSFQIPEKLYGREAERAVFLNAFDTIQEGKMEFILVSGYSGIGKTALIRELYKPVTAKRSYFLSGKFEQFQRDIPFSAFITAIKGLIQQLLGESERRLAHWKKEIMDALGANAGVLTEVVPSLEMIIGPQNPPTPLPPVENQNRFNTVLEKFFRDLSTAKHAFVIFIDDWQWADSSSLNLLKLLTTDLENQYLLFIAAYRDNEVDASHPFAMSLAEIQKTQAVVKEIQLKELDSEHIVEMLQDTLRESEEGVLGLAKLIKNKTSGNPFFVTQFLQNLHEGGHIHYDYTRSQWQWDALKIQALPISNNVLDLMSARIRNLKTEAQKLLQWAACIGNNFSLKLLSQLSGISQTECRLALLETLEQGLIVPHLGDHYAIEDETDKGVFFRFLHDRVEQAANQMMNTEEFTANQWKIGQIILSEYSEEYLRENLFDTLNYLNSGRSHAASESQKQELAQLNYEAGKKAKRSTAYSAAHTFLTISIEYFGADLWESDYEKAFDLHKEAAEAAYLAGKNEEADKSYAICLGKAQTSIQKVQIYVSQLRKYQTEGKFEEAYQIERKALALLGIVIPDKEEEMLPLFQEELGKVDALLGDRNIEDLINAAEMQDEEKVWTLDILSNLFTTSIISGKQLSVAYSISKMTNTTLLYGNNALTSNAYALFGLLNCAALNQPHRGYRFGKIGYDLSTKYSNLSVRASVNHFFSMLVKHHTSDPKECTILYEDAIKYGLEGGNFEFAGHATLGKMLNKIWVSFELNNLFLEAQKSLLLMRKVNPGAIGWAYEPGIFQPILNLTGRTKSDDSFDTDEFSESSFLETYKDMPLAQAWFYSSKIRNLYILAYYPKAFTLLDKVDLISTVHAGIMSVPLTHYYAALLILANWERLTEGERETHKPKLEEYLDKLKTYAQNCPWHYEAKLALVQAEYKAYIEGSWDAIEDYEKAIRLANEAEDPQQEGVASERAALFFLHRNKKEIAKIYFQRSLYAYESWGAEAKVKQLKSNYPEFFAFAGKKSTGYTITNTVFDASIHTTHYGQGTLDLLSVMKASQAISQEIKLDSLLRKVITILMENAGAERAMLIQDRENILMIAAEASIHSNDIEIMRAVPITKEDRDKMPLDIIRKVHRTQETIVTDQVKKDSRFAMDTYIQKSNLKSVLCLPILQQGKTRLVIYMEHSQIAGAFTYDRVEILRMLSSQIAISIENSVLYDTMEQKVAERTADLEQANTDLKDKNTRITDSIRYAKTMQNSILPTEEELKKAFSDHFVLYRPKDVVSGDFYWYAHIDNKHILAVADCTGHGVPGAFMSMTGNGILDEIVKQKKISDPSQILELLNLAIIEALRQRTSDNTDGMDIGIAVVEKTAENNFRLSYAGAKRPLFYVKEKTLERISADRRSIGGRQNIDKLPFQNFILDLPAASKFYMSTDGFADQNNAQRHTFNLRRFTEMLEQNSHLPFKEQGLLYAKYLDDFMGNEYQRDDITLIGICL
jgi:histidine kinase